MLTGDTGSAATNPFPLPDALPPDLQTTLDYWRGLLRGEARMPFWDDLDIAALGEVAPRALAIEVFDKPQRFRLDIVGSDIDRRAGGGLQGRFPDRESRQDHPLEFILAQASATVEAAAPTFYANADGPDGPYARIVLPMWGDGRISMLLGAVAWGTAGDG